MAVFGQQSGGISENDGQLRAGNYLARGSAPALACGSAV